jgi:60 kDa SS-A/Ro ribonucleoprotein
LTVTCPVSTKETPQSEAVPGKNQVENNAGGFGFQVDDWARLDRFLILGSEGGTYYVTEKELTRDNAKIVERCFAADPERTVNRIVEVSQAGRAPKNDAAIFALALCVSVDPKQFALGGQAQIIHGRTLAYDALPRVARTGTHLFQFVETCNELRGWGEGLRKAVAKWYTEKTADQLAYQVTKYQQRNRWSHRDVLRKCHASAPQDEMGRKQAVLRWAVTGMNMGERSVTRGKDDKAKTRQYFADATRLPESIIALEQLKNAATVEEAIRLIEKYEGKAPRELVPTTFLADKRVWGALLPHMPMTAMVRNLGTMTRNGLLAPLSDTVRHVCDELRNAERVKKARLHPLSILVALKTYQSGRGVKSDGEVWSPVQQIVDALNDAFYLAFDAVEPTGKRWLLGLDVSGSMNSPELAGMTGITPRIGSATMALVTASIERNYHIVGFTGRGFKVNSSPVSTGAWGWNANNGSGVEPLSISPRQRLDSVINAISALPMGPTDCALPMLYAMERKMPVDVFAIYTDSETWHGSIHPFQALKQYREKMGIAAKMVVVGMTSTGFTIADPSDPGMLDVVGFSTDVPAVMGAFAA